MAEGRQTPQQRLPADPLPRPEGSHHHQSSDVRRRHVQLPGGEPNQQWAQHPHKTDRVQ